MVQEESAMKVFRNTFVLLIILAGLLGYYYYTQKTAKPPETNAVLSLKKSEITSLDIRQGQQDLISLARTGGKWKIVKPIEYDVDSINLNDLLNAASSVKADRKLSDSDLSKYGLDNPSYTVSIGLGDDRSVKLLIGNSSPVGNAYFVKVSNKPYVYRVESTALEKFMLSGDFVYQYAQKYIYQTAKDKITKIAYIKSGDEYTLQKNKDGSWVRNGKKLNKDSMDKLLDDIVLLQITGIDVGKSPSPNNYDFGLAVYGGNSVEKAFFVTKDKDNSYVIKDGKSLGMYVASDSLTQLLNDLTKAIK